MSIDLNSTSVEEAGQNGSGHLSDLGPPQQIDYGDQAYGRFQAREVAPVRAGQSGHGRHLDQGGAGKAVNETPLTGCADQYARRKRGSHPNKTRVPPGRG